MSILGKRYLGHHVRVKLAKDPEGFLVEEPVTRAGMAEPERPKQMVA